MKVVGFSFIKDAVKMQYPIAEAILSILPLCDEVIVAVGASTDGTRALVESLGPKIKIIDTEWDFTLKENGKLLAAETDKAFKAIPADADWCIYIQGDEVLHEDGFAAIKKALLQYKDDAKVDGLLCNYRHFFGSYDYVALEAKWYRHEIRIVKNNKNIYSYRDAQGFRKNNNEKLCVKPVNAYIQHYGWVQSPYVMKLKQAFKNKIYHAGEFDENNIISPKDYGDNEPWYLTKYKLKHPAVMAALIAKADWTFNYDLTKNKLKFKDYFKTVTEKLFGIRLFDYRNYKKV